MATQEDSKICQLLSMKGNSRLEVKSDLSDKILSLDYLKYPGINLRFLETKRKEKEAGDWDEYNILFSALKYQDTSEYLSFVIKNLGEVIKILGEEINLDVIGIQEIDCSQPDYYYVLLYILSNGKDKKKEDIND